MVGGNRTFVSLFSAANGVGKSACGANIVAHILFGNSGNKYFNHPLFDKFPYSKKGRIIADPATVKETIVPELEKWLPLDRYQARKASKDYACKWETDTGFSFDIMTYDQDIKEFESSTLGFAWFDEPPPLSIFKATVARMRRGGIIFITATPLTGSAWMYDHILCYTGDKGQRDFIEADVESNCIEHGIRGILRHEDIQKMIAEYDESDLQARVHGKFQHLIGLVFKQFSRKIHVIKPFTLNPRDFCSIEMIDPHPRNPDAVMWLAINRKGTKFVTDELYMKGKTSELAERIKKIEEKHRIILRVGDPSMFVANQHDDRPEEETLAMKLQNKYDLEYEPASKNRVAANRAISDALDYVQEAGEMILSPDVFVFNTCPRTIYEFEHWQWDDWRGKTAERKAPMEKPMDKDDHMMENLGRGLLLDPVFIPMQPKKERSLGIKQNFDIYD